MKQHSFLLVVLLFCLKNAYSQDVNHFTGGFTYGVPLLTVPSYDNGPSIPVNAMYGAGIGVHQSSSDIGLGWMLGAGGAITRSVSGVPDDWKSPSLPHGAKPAFETHTGTMYLKGLSGATGGVLDFYKTQWKVNYDTVAFYFPDYDYYSISGPGMMGSLEPHLFDYATIDITDGTYKIKSDSNQFVNKLQFTFRGDYYDTLVSRYYQTTPINSGTVAYRPSQSVTYSLDNLGSSTTPFTGRYNNGYDRTSSVNRLASPNYIEYFTNSEINTGVTDFIDFRSTHTRSSSDFELDGIGAFRITDPNGYVYHYSLPVYINYTIYGNYPLNNDYSVKNTYDDAKVTGGNGTSYYRKDADNGDMVTEWKQDHKYAYMWLLIAITGPDYNDTNNDDMANEGDEGYWVSFDYQLWSGNFSKRTPEYGFEYSFAGGENEDTENDAISVTSKISGKVGSWSLFNQQLYYLNSIQTSTHKAIFVRDLRNDNIGSPDNYDNDFKLIKNLDATVHNTTLSSWRGTLYDDGGSAANYSNNIDRYVTIKPSNGDKVKVTFTDFEVRKTFGEGDYVKVFDCEACTTDAKLIGTYYTFDGTEPTTITSSNGNALTIKFYSDNLGTGTGFEMNWETVWETNSRPDVAPQLKLSKIILTRNEDNLPSLSTITSSAGTNWDFSKTTRTDNKIYNEDWYTANSSTINSISVKTIEFSQDYKLSRKYYSNINTFSDNNFKDTPPTTIYTNRTIVTGQNDNSGKLTLNEITVYEVGHVKTAPSVKFDYDTAIVANNPDFNPKAIDNWGFYKSDISTNGYSSYTTSTSKDYTDAWSLRKITTPLGATIEMEYESNQYEKVFSEQGGFKGASRTYLLNDATEYVGYTKGEDWNITLEDDVTDFWDLVNSPPTGTTRQVFIPFKETAVLYKVWGTGTITNSPTRVTDLSTLYSSDAAVIDYETSTFSITNSINYTGNGYINFDLPVGETVYGGGIRVKKIITRNSGEDAYVQEYTYDEGVAPTEPDRFASPKQRKDVSSTLTYIKLRGFDASKHRAPAQVGYTTVTVKDLGKSNTDNGSTVYTFITSDSEWDNYKINSQKRITNAWDASDGSACISGGYKDTSFILEAVDKFSSVWGAVEQVEVRDVNDNIISKTVNTYTSTDQGAIVENYLFERVVTMTGGGPIPPTCKKHHNIICILREYPVVLTKQTTFSKGYEETTENLRHDDRTGEITYSLISAPNKSTVVERVVPAFRISQYSALGPKSTGASNKNFLTPFAEIRTSIDTTITSSSDFASHDILVLSNSIYIRKYNTTTNIFENRLTTTSWRPVKSYHWKGNSTSLDSYGLFKSTGSDYTAFDHTLASIDSRWRFVSENTLFDKRGNVLEVKGFNDRFVAKRYGYDSKFKIGEISNSNHASFTCSGFEYREDVNAGTYYFEGEIKQNDGVQIQSATGVTPHTGSYLMKVPSTATTYPAYSVKYNSTSPNSGLIKDRVYRASVWVHTSSPADCKLVISYTGQASKSLSKSSASGITIGDWTLLNLEYIVLASPNNNDELKITLEKGTGGDAYFDDLRLHCVESPMTAYVYDAISGRVVAVLDENNFSTRFVYDAGGNLLEEWKEIEGSGFKKIKSYQYNFGRGL